MSSLLVTNLAVRAVASAAAKGAAERARRALAWSGSTSRSGSGSNHGSAGGSPRRAERGDGEPTDLQDGDGAGALRLWTCTDCGTVHVRNPETCRACGYTVFDPTRAGAHPSVVAVRGSRDTSPTANVVAAVSDAAGMDPTTLPSLYHAVDSDALDAFVESANDASVSFEYAGFTVVVFADGTALVLEDG